MSTWIPTVNAIVDNVDPVNGATVNPIVASLVSRDQYLFDRIDSYDDKSALLAYTVPLGASSGVVTNTVVYYKPNEGLFKALSTYATSVDPAHLIPGKEAFVFGIVKSTYAVDSTTSADVYVRGLIDININLLLDSTSRDLGATASDPTGPLYLSGLEAGKLTKFPGGTSVFVGYATTPTQLFLAPNIDSLNQLYFNYKVYLLDKPAGTPLNSSGTWTVTSPSYTSVGWVGAASAGTQYGYPVPTGAKFFYNLPTAAQIQASGTLTAIEKKDALLLKDAIPAYPAAYTQLFLNGVLQHAYDADHTTGIYIVNNNGIWWCADSTTYKPWFTSPDPRITITLQTTKLNPHYKAAVVSSMQPFVDGSNDTSQVLTFVNAETGEPATSGDLKAKFALNIDSEDESPVSNVFIKDVNYNALTGELILKTSPGIVDVVASPGLTATKLNGVVTIGLSNFALSGTVSDIEPEEADFVYKGLHSYLRIKSPAAGQRIGLVGKIPLPSVLPANLPLHVKLLMFGESTSASFPVKFKFEYSISKPGLISDAVYKADAGADIDVTNFTANVAQLIEKDGSDYYFEVPANLLVANSFLNFRIARVTSNYTAPIGVLGTYWAIE